MNNIKKIFSIAIFLIIALFINTIDTFALSDSEWDDVEWIFKINRYINKLENNESLFHISLNGEDKMIMGYAFNTTPATTAWRYRTAGHVLHVSPTAENLRGKAKVKQLGNYDRNIP